MKKSISLICAYDDIVLGDTVEETADEPTMDNTETSNHPEGQLPHTYFELSASDSSF